MAHNTAKSGMVNRRKFHAYGNDTLRFGVANNSQCACFHRYGSTNVEFQNCIALDCGLPDETNGKFTEVFSMKIMILPWKTPGKTLAAFCSISAPDSY